MRGGGTRCYAFAVAIGTILVALVLESLWWDVYSIHRLVAVSSTTRSASFIHEDLPSPQQSQNEINHPPTILLCSYLFGEASANQKLLQQLFLQSAAGSGVDVVLVGDVRPSVLSHRSAVGGTTGTNLPPNVQHYFISWDDFITLAEQRLSFNGTLLRTGNTRPHHRVGRPYYKINDFKPVFGRLFPFLVANYTWWGHVDNDVVLGDIAGMAAPYLTTRDVISGNDTYSTWGPLTFYRNDERINTLYQKSVLTPQELFGVPRTLYFDEWMGWGPYRKKRTDVEPRSMSKIVDHYVDPSRVQRGIGPYGKDRSCKWNMTEHCGECFFLKSLSSLSPVAVPAPRRNLLVKWDPQAERYVQVLLCHYKISKNRIEALLRHNQEVDGEDPAASRNDSSPFRLPYPPAPLDEFRVSGADGVQPITAQDRAQLDEFLISTLPLPSR